MMKIAKETLTKLQCSDCRSVLSCAPVMLGEDGKNICGRCYVYADSSLRRNNVYEELAKYVEFPCRYKAKGCPEILFFSAVKRHEEGCKFREYNCPSMPFGNCEWTGQRNEIFDHFKASHLDLTIEEHPCKLKPDITKDNESNMMTMMFGLMFVIQVRCTVRAAKIWHCVRCIGDSRLASLFEYTLEITNNDSVLKKKSDVHPEERLTIHQNDCIETSLNTVLGFLRTFKNVEFIIHINVKQLTCTNCKNDLVLPMTYSSYEGPFCEVCAPDETSRAQDLWMLYDKMSCIRNSHPVKAVEPIKRKVKKSHSIKQFFKPISAD